MISTRQPRYRRGGFGIFALTVCSGLASAQTPLYTLMGPYDFGTDLDSVGDVNGDGFDDFAIAIPRDPTAGTDAGSIKVVSGATGTYVLTMLGYGTDDQYGARVLAGGDANADGVPDILGASLESSQSPLGGYVRLHSGANGVLIRKFTAPANDIGFGRAVATGEDLDLDGRDDIAIGAPFSNVVYTFSSATGAVLNTFTPLTSTDDTFGSSVDFITDLDNDQKPDVLIGAPSGNYAAVRSTKDQSSLRHWTGTAQDDRFGTDVTRVADVDNDGRDDALIGAPRADTNGMVAGRATIYSTSTTLLLHAVDGLGGYEYGSRVESAGDVDGDGTGDFLVGTAMGDIAHLYSGATGDTIAAYPGDGTSFGYGGVLAGRGDVDGDGTPDVIVGSSGNPLPFLGLTTVKVFTGCMGGFGWAGQGCGTATASGIEPKLDGSGCPTSNGWITLRISGKNNPTVALMLLGLSVGYVPMGAGCPVLVLPPIPSALTMTLAPQTLGSAESTITFPMPASLPTGSIWLQAVLPENPGYATTNALRVNVE